MKSNYSPWYGTWDGLPEYYAPCYNVQTDEVGRILVKTRSKITGIKECVYDVFNSEGRFLATVNLKNAGFRLWANQRLYAIEEDNDGFWVVKAYRIKWSFDHSD